MPAFVIPADDDGGEDVVFLKSMEDLDPEISAIPKPAPEFDQYESIGYVPSKALIENGWHLYCDECERRSDDEEDEDHEGRSVEHVFKGQFYFCHPECSKTYWAQRDRERAVDKFNFHDSILLI